jgi:hypothetical protein
MARLARLEAETTALAAQCREATGEIARLLAKSAAERDATRALLIKMRRYIMQHDLQIGECVAWNRLKRRYGVGQSSSAADEAWLAAYSGEEGGYR